MKDQKYYDDLDRRIENLYLQSIEDRKRAEADRKRAEEDRKRAEEDRKSFKEQSKRYDRFFDHANKQFDMMEKQFAKINQEFGLRWDFAEETMYRWAKELFERTGIHINHVYKNILGKEREYDLVCENDTVAILVEVKNYVRKQDIDYLLRVQLPDFKKDVKPKYNFDKFNLYWAIAWLVVDDDAAKYAYRNWLYVLRQSWSYLTTANDAKFKPKVFS